ncbi:hypothetical protein AAE478_010230 [Parahypoxylon ruwenzoriense]
MASHQDHPFSSNNPFRRRPGNPSGGGPTLVPVLAPNIDGPFDSIPPTHLASFKTVVPEAETGAVVEEGAAPVQPKPKKIVKKVRVQSPPPSSPESSPEDAVPVTRFPPVGTRNDDDDDEGDDDASSSDSREYGDRLGPSNTASSDTRDDDSYGRARTRPPANPFSKTLQDIEHTEEGQGASALAAGAAVKGSLDVDSFKRLLLTGYANIPGSSPPAVSGLGKNSKNSTATQPALHDGASNTDASSVSRQSIFDAMLQETPRTSHEISEPEDPEERRGVLPTSPLSSARSSSTRKKPPPPSSRHGKLIKIELGADIERRATKNLTSTSSNSSLPTTIPPAKSSPQSFTLSQSPPSTTDVNKPLPLTPFHPTVEDAVDSPFDREAIGKVPEPFSNLQANTQPPTPPVATRSRSESDSSTQPRKPAAPPPRRHGRSDSKTPSIKAVNADDEAPPRSSLESDRSKSDSLRANNSSNNNLNAPAPPPPRRPQHSRQISSYTSPSQGSFVSVPATSLGAGESDRIPVGSTQGSINNGGQMEGLGELATFTTSKDGTPKLSPPPPPPARQASTRRPPSVRSIDLGNGIGTARRVSREKEGGVAPPPPPPPRQRGSSRASVENTASSGTEGARSGSDEVQRNEKEPTISSTQITGNDKQGAEILADLNALQREVDALMGRYGKPGGS